MITTRLLVPCFILMTTACGRMTTIDGGPQVLRSSQAPIHAVSSYQLVIDPRVSYVPDPIAGLARQAISDAITRTTADFNLVATTETPDLWIICYREEPERLRAAGDAVRVDVSLDQQFAFTYHYPFPADATYGPHARGNLIIDLVRADDQQLVTQTADLSFFDHQWQIGLTGRGQLDATRVVRMALNNALAPVP